jgi:hypothetical protein
MLLYLTSTRHRNLFKPGQPLPVTAWKCLTAPNFLPRRLHKHLTEEFFEGYCMVFSAILRILRRASQVPSPQRIVSTMRSPKASQILLHYTEPTSSLGIEYFLSNEGWPDYAVDTILCLAALREGDSIESEYETNNEYSGLPECSNDFEFSLVRWKLNLLHDACGPHMSLLSWISTSKT